MELIAVVHDPEGRMIPLLNHLKPVLERFPRPTFSLTPFTSHKLKQALESLGVTVINGGLPDQTRLSLLNYVSTSVFYFPLQNPGLQTGDVKESFPQRERNPGL